jgi:hypothetical protein
MRTPWCRGGVELLMATKKDKAIRDGVRISHDADREARQREPVRAGIQI